MNIFIQKAEEEALGIDQNTTGMHRRDNQIPDSDGFAIEADQRQMSTNLSDKHHTNSVEIGEEAQNSAS